MQNKTTNHIVVNGEEIDLDSVTTLEQLLERFQVSQHDQGVAVAVNEQIIPKQHWASTSIQPNDTIEIIRAVAGG